MLTFGRKQDAVLSFAQQAVKSQQSGRLQNNSGTENPRRANEKRAQPGEDPICGTQVWCALASSIEHQQLMPQEHGLGHNRTESPRLRQSGHGDDQMNEHDREIAHPGKGINASQSSALRPIWQFAMDTMLWI